MSNIVQFPRHHPGKKWSPTEILAIAEPPDTRQQVRQERSRIATTKAVAATAGKRESKKAKRKKQIVEILNAGEERTVGDLACLVGDRVSRQTVAEYLKELEAEGQVYKVGCFWISTKGLEV